MKKRIKKKKKIKLCNYYRQVSERNFLTQFQLLAARTGIDNAIVLKIFQSRSLVQREGGREEFFSSWRQKPFVVRFSPSSLVPSTLSVIQSY